jgi:hypothetical protein
MITFYDIALKDPIKTASPNTWKTRYDTLWSMTLGSFLTQCYQIRSKLQEASVPDRLS